MTSSDVKQFQAIPAARVAGLERLSQRRDRDFKQLRDARAALRRIEKGSFGACEQCEEDIHPKRLSSRAVRPNTSSRHYREGRMTAAGGTHCLESSMSNSPHPVPHNEGLLCVPVWRPACVAVARRH
jgi:hypothetical protein